MIKPHLKKYKTKLDFISLRLTEILPIIFKFKSIFSSEFEISLKKIKEEIKFHKKGLAIFFIALTLIFVILNVLSGINVLKNYKLRSEALNERQNIISKVKYWENIVDSYKDYRDGYFTLAILYYELKDFEKANNNLKKTLELDPNFEQGISLERILNNK